MLSNSVVTNGVGRGALLHRASKRIGMVLLVLCAIASCLAIWVMPWDQQLSIAARSLKVPGDVRKAIELSEAFAHGSGCAVILSAVFLGAVKQRRAVLLAVLMTTSSGVMANGLKAAFVRLRPYAVSTHAVVLNGGSRASATSINFLGQGSFWEASQRSFPSGHTATAWGLAIGLSLVFPRVTLLMIGLAALASFQRLYGGAHFLSDIFAGAAIAFFCCAVIMAWPKAQQVLAEARR